MRPRQLLYLFITVSFFACKKESIPDVEPSTRPAVYTLVYDRGICSNMVVDGVYTVGVAMDSSNKSSLQVNVTSTGTYTVSAVANYGIQFSASGIFANKGLQTVILKGMGTPTAAGVFAYLFAAGSSSCRFNVTIGNPTTPALVDNDHLLFGNPSNAAALADSANNYLMLKGYYSLSYSRDRGTPNWVSWHLYAADIGSTPRQDDFRHDPDIPPGWYQVPETAYSGSGFDRGHNLPSGDRTSSVVANSSTFLMTNIIPQAPQLNQNTWAMFEDSLRRLVSMGSEIYTVMGSYGCGGTGSDGFTTTIHGGKETVPASIWRIAVVMPNGNDDTSRVTNSTSVIAVNMPNNNSTTGSWKSYRVTVDAIEAVTGYDLLKRFPVALQTVLEGRVDNF